MYYEPGIHPESIESLNFHGKTRCATATRREGRRFFIDILPRGFFFAVEFFRVLSVRVKFPWSPELNQFTTNRRVKLTPSGQFELNLCQTRRGKTARGRREL